MPETKGSFRDNSGFVFKKEGIIYRQINLSYKDNYNTLLNSGLYEDLQIHSLLISHSEVELSAPNPERVYKIVKPERIPFISYPYEWCFSELKQAALVTLEIQRTALKFGMSLKDASAFNIQFLKSKPIFIDTLSFEKYKEGEPWVAYRQFCQHFLAPLVLMSFSDVRFNKLLRLFIDGIPLDFASRVLPFRAKTKFPVFFHIALHALSQKTFASKPIKMRQNNMSLKSLSGLIDSLEKAVSGLKCKSAKSEWENYYDATNYTKEMLEEKRTAVNEFLDIAKPKIVWDMGANTGYFSREAAKKSLYTVSFDNDFNSVEFNFLRGIENREDNILPLVMDLTNPSPGIGWQNRERMSLIERGPADTVLALALIHHLSITNNVHLLNVAEFLSFISRYLIIEFVPKKDSQVQKLLQNREDIFNEYNKESFEKAFGRYFETKCVRKITGSERSIYLMKNKSLI